ncbi:hypothetical protein ACP3TG_29040 [Phytobacter diazotrophicus]
MSDLSAAIVHLTMYFNDIKLSTGSGVFYKRDDKYYIVTAWHNVTGRNTETLDYLDTKNLAVPNKVGIGLKNFTGDYYSTWVVYIPLYDENGALFYVHPENWPRIDVVAIPFDPFKTHLIHIKDDNGTVQEYGFNLGDNTDNCPIRTIQDFLAPKEMIEQWWETVSVTDEVFIPGYPHNITDYYYNPVWKRATIASAPQKKWNDERKFLIDSASSSGMSGASVFYYSAKGHLKVGGYHIYNGYPTAIHAGIYVGRIGVTSKADPQVGTVWHASVVDEIIDGAVYDVLNQDIKLGTSEQELVIKDYLKKESSEHKDNILKADSSAKHYAFNAVMHELKGRASPDELRLLIQDVCKAYTGPFAGESD